MISIKMLQITPSRRVAAFTRTSGGWHGLERRYRLVPARFGPVRDWIAHYERFWDDHLQRLQKYLTKGNKND
jgi:hypothetical protein